VLVLFNDGKSSGVKMNSHKVRPGVYFIIELVIFISVQDGFVFIYGGIKDRVRVIRLTPGTVSLSYYH